MTAIEWFGFFAAFMSSACFLPQAILVIRTRKTEGLSLTMYCMFTIAVSMWLGYGLMTEIWPIAISNLIKLVLALIIFTILIQNRLASRAQAKATIAVRV